MLCYTWRRMPIVDQEQESSLRAELVAVGRVLYQRGLVVASDGNISARLGAERFLVTPSGACKGTLTADQLLVVDAQGAPVDGRALEREDRRPSSELAMHLEAYRLRSEVRAIVHAHPPHAIALSIAGIPLEPYMLPEAIVFLGRPATSPYAPPSSPEGAEAIREAVAGHDAIVLERHGSLALGKDPRAALHNTERLEQLARITFLLHCLRPQARTAGGDAAWSLDGPAIDRLLEIRRGLGLERAGDAADFSASARASWGSGRG